MTEYAEYISAANTAKLIRQALRESFPGVKFSVTTKTYAGGASISVSYTDGPADKLVEAVVSVFEASYFDGMIDYQGSRYAILDGKKVRFGADYINVNRSHSDAMIGRAIAGLRSKYEGDFKRLEAEGVEITVENFNRGELYRSQLFGGSRAMNDSLQSMIHQRLGKISNVAMPQRSETLARIKFAGDDGYGAGTVGDLSVPESQRRTSQGYPGQYLVQEEMAKKAAKAAAEIPAPNVIAFPFGGRIH